MKTQIDIKSAVLGIVIGVLAMFALGAGTSGNEVDRYRVSVGASFAIMVDSKTGQGMGKSPARRGHARRRQFFRAEIASPVWGGIFRHPSVFVCLDRMGNV